MDAILLISYHPKYNKTIEIACVGARRTDFFFSLLVLENINFGNNIKNLTLFCKWGAIINHSHKLDSVYNMLEQKFMINSDENKFRFLIFHLLITS